jgi:hypothetical protein
VDILHNRDFVAARQVGWSLMAVNWYTRGDSMDFEIVGAITSIKTIATGPAIRDLPRLRRRYGGDSLV